MFSSWKFQMSVEDGDAGLQGTTDQRIFEGIQYGVPNDPAEATVVEWAISRDGGSGVHDA
jgi:hypothetical protein